MEGMNEVVLMANEKVKSGEHWPAHLDVCEVRYADENCVVHGGSRIALVRDPRSYANDSARHCIASDVEQIA